MIYIYFINLINLTEPLLRPSLNLVADIGGLALAVDTPFTDGMAMFACLAARTPRVV